MLVKPTSRECPDRLHPNSIREKQIIDFYIPGFIGEPSQLTQVHSCTDIMNGLSAALRISVLDVMTGRRGI